MHRLLILGSLDEFVGIIEKARARGIYTVVCDGYKNTAGKRHGDKSYDIAVGNIDEIAQMCAAEKIDGIITSFSDYLFECMVKIAKKANLKCYMTPDRLPYYRDKTCMKDMMKKMKIPTTKYVYLDQGFHLSQLDTLSFPVAAKPVDRYGSRGLMVLYTPQDVQKHFDEICETSDIKKILVEEYHDGWEFNMMSWVLDGVVHTISIADREKTAISKSEIPISSRNVYPSRLKESVEEQARDILQKVVDFTGQKEGPLSMQFFWKKETGVQVCEIAGRFFGYEHELTELAGGLDIEKLLLDYVYDEPAVRKSFETYDAQFTQVAAVLYFHGKPGKVVWDQSILEKLATHPNVVMSQIFYHKGEEIVLHGPNAYAVRYYIVGRERAEVDTITEQFYKEISIKDPNGEEVLYQNNRTDYGTAI